jgi:hypothetical protein
MHPVAADKNGGIVQKCAPFTHAVKHFLFNRIVNNTEMGHALPKVSNGNSKLRKAMGVIRRSIQRIDNPGVL